MTNHYDYIFTGAGCAGFSLLMRLIKSGSLKDKKVLIIDKSSKTANDRTWCFWEKKTGFFESLVHHSWDNLGIYGQEYAGTFDIAPYRYKMIRGIDFYNHCLDQIRSTPQVTMLQDEIIAIGNHGNAAFVTTTGDAFTADYVFNSTLLNHTLSQLPALKINASQWNGSPIIHPEPGPASTSAQTINSLTPNPSISQYYTLLQHFKGFFIRTAADVFDPNKGTLMDFRVSQHNGTTFVYVLPLSEREALVEYTLFTAGLLSQQEYDVAIHEYIKTVLNINTYEIVSSEFGVIPMTNVPFPAYDGRVIHIGTAGGQTKPSTGYTFTSIQKQADAMASRLATNKFPIAKTTFAAKKFNWYDSILLNVLATGKLPGAFIFTELFRKNRIADVFRFLDNESSLAQDLTVIRALPVLTFAKAAVQQATKPPGSPVLHT
ncbi:lycopene cyclase family protein [Flavitalea antarctica]